MNDVIGLLGPGILLATPILYAALGGLFTQRAGIFNIGLEGFMLLAAFFSVSVAVSTGSLLVGTVAGILVATLAALVMAVLVVGFRADEVIVGIAINVFALGLTTFLLAEAQTSGRSLELPAGYPRLDPPWLADVPVLGPIFNSRDALIWSLIPAALTVGYVFTRTQFGLRLKAAGENPMAARAAGVRVASVRFASILISGALTGIGGAALAIGSVHLFSENMTSGRGIIAFAAVIFGAGLVSRTAAACLLFGFAQALAGLLQIRTDFPPQVVLMVPFLLTILAITSSDALRRRRSPRSAGDVTTAEVHEAEHPTIVIAGHLTIDEIRLADGRVLPETVGGAAAYAALGAFVAQGDIVILSVVGEDYSVEKLELSHLDGGRIRTEQISRVPGRSIRNIARYGADGGRVFDIEDFTALVSQTPSPADLRNVDVRDRWVLVAPATVPQQAELVAALRAAGARIALDTELHYLTDAELIAQLRQLIPEVDCFLPSLEHIRHLFEAPGIKAEPRDLKQFVDLLGCPLTIVKCARMGAVVFGPDTPAGFPVPAVPDLEVADPTGAGDGFNGGLLVGLARGERPTAATATGCVAASFVVQAIGASVPEVFSGHERASRYRQCSRIEESMKERDELV